MNIQDNIHDLFWLAHYAHRAFAPIFADAKKVEPSLQYSIEVNVADENSIYYKQSHVSVAAHWDREGMLVQAGHLESIDDIDRVAAYTRYDVDQLKEAQ